PHGSGDLGAGARRFVEFLVRAEQGWWQMLPVGPVGYGDSPYSALSAVAGSTLLVDLDPLGIDTDAPRFVALHGDYDATKRCRAAHLRRALAAFRGARELSEFREREEAWLEDWALFAALKRAHRGAAWVAWERGVRLREPGALARARRELEAELAF